MIDKETAYAAIGKPINKINNSTEKRSIGELFNARIKPRRKEQKHKAKT